MNNVGMFPRQHNYVRQVVTCPAHVYTVKAVTDQWRAAGWRGAASAGGVHFRGKEGKRASECQLQLNRDHVARSVLIHRKR